MTFEDVPDARGEHTTRHWPCERCDGSGEVAAEDVALVEAA